jgi:hypothetical protein
MSRIEQERDKLRLLLKQTQENLDYSKANQSEVKSSLKQ